MKQVLILSLLLLQVAGARGSDNAKRPDNSKLPECDKVEVLRIEGTFIEAPDGRIYTQRDHRPPGIGSYYIEYGGRWTRLLGVDTLRGAEAEKIAHLWRALAPAAPAPEIISEPAPPPPARKSKLLKLSGLDKCHEPGFAYRFYRDEDLLAESTVCWTCENLGIKVGTQFTSRGFDPDAESAKLLLAKSIQLFPKIQKRPK